MTTEDEVKPFEENFEWTAENELHLFNAMDGPKPVGINKHFIMACICEKFETLVGRPVSPEILWRQMNSMYDMAALDKKESIPFPTEEEDFNLPEEEFGELMNEKIEKVKTEPVNEAPVKDGRSTPKVTKDNKQTKETANKKEKEKEEEKKVESEEKESESDKKESEETEAEIKKGKGKKEEKPAEKPKRGKRSMAAKKTEEEAPATNNKKSEEETPSNKKEKQPVGKRTLRSRGDDSASNKSSTPPPNPPAKRARRI